jgi:sugar lactone lactonase YvrE
VQALARSQQGPLGIAVAGGQVYWTSTEGRRVSRVAASGGLVAIVADTAERPFTLAADGTHLSWIAHASTEDGLWRAPLLESESQLLRALTYTLSKP